jgi:hypothetical protein
MMLASEIKGMRIQHRLGQLSQEPFSCGGAPRCKQTGHPSAAAVSDDSGMHHHAKESGVNSIWMRITDLKTLERKQE